MRVREEKYRVMNEPRTVVEPKYQDVAPLVRAWLHALGNWLRTPYGMVIAGLAVGGVGLVVGWEWLLAIGALPILLSALPCVIMCALGVCMMGRKDDARNTPRAEPPAPTSDSASVDSAAGNEREPGQ